MLIGSGSQAGPATAAGDGGAGPIKDVTLQSFAQDVIEASMKVPVLVDFWAPWCGPCKQLTPVLEKLVKQAKGKVKLAKINIDENPEIAQQMRVQSVPTVFAFVGGQPATGFAGAQPESQIKSLIEKLIGGPMGPADTDEMLKAAQDAMDQGNIAAASDIYQAILQAEEGCPEALGGLARCLISLGDYDRAQEVIELAPDAHQSHSALTGAGAALALARQAGDIGDPQSLTAAIAADANDHNSRYQLATSMFLRGQTEAAMQELCTIVKADRSWEDDGARKQLVKFFEALGPTHPATIKGRRMLSSVLFS